MAKKIKNEETAVRVNPKLYPLEVIYDACYYFLDDFYIRLEGDPKKEVKIYLKNKKEASFKNKDTKGEFLNHILSSSLRYEISKKNQKIRESFVAAALGTFEGRSADCECEEGGKYNDWADDPLNIAIPWEEKHEKKVKTPASAKAYGGRGKTANQKLKTKKKKR